MSSSTSMLKSNILWLPASPLEGWASMDRYWRELHSLAVETSPSDFRFSCALPQLPPDCSSKSSGWRRNVEKYIAYPWRVRGAQADLCHLLDHSYSHLLSYLPKSIPKVVTIFDLVPLEDHSGLSQNQVARFRRTVANLSHADRLISISEETKKKLHAMLGIPLEKIHVVLPGMNYELFQQRSQPSNKTFDRLSGLPPIIFSIGSTASRKNLRSLPEIFNGMRNLFKQKQCCFVRAGAYLPEELRKDLIDVIGEEGLLELGPIFGEDLIAAYQAARVLIFPSVLEGLTFVIPEAMAAGCPVVTNTHTANPEAAGGAGLLYEEGDFTEAAEHLKSVLLNDEVHSRMKDLGLRRASQMTWKHHFEAVLRIYREILD